MTDFTANYSIPLPNPAGDLEEDVLVLRDAFVIVDSTLKTNSNAIAQKLGKTATAKDSEKLGGMGPEEFATREQGDKADAAIPDAPVDSKPYVRRNSAWVEQEAGGIPDALSNGTAYGRRNAAWVDLDARFSDATKITSGVFDPARLPTATTAAQGAMPAADKTKLNNATSANTANTLVLRGAAGQATFGALTVASVSSSGAMSAASLTCSGDITAYSDETLKDNIEVIENALEKIKDIRGVTFEWKSNGLPSAGLIAQDVNQVLPEGISKQADGILAISLAAPVALLIEAVKTLANKVEELEAKNGTPR